jgi:hypothetical protein
MFKSHHTPHNELPSAECRAGLPFSLHKHDGIALQLQVFHISFSSFSWYYEARTMSHKHSRAHVYKSEGFIHLYP